MCWLPSGWRIRSTELGLGTPSNCPASFSCGGDGGGGSCSSTPPPVYRAFCNTKNSILNHCPAPNASLNKHHLWSEYCKKSRRWKFRRKRRDDDRLQTWAKINVSRYLKHPVENASFLTILTRRRSRIVRTILGTHRGTHTLGDEILRLYFPRSTSVSVSTFGKQTSLGRTFGTFRKIIFTRARQKGSIERVKRGISWNEGNTFRPSGTTLTDAHACIGFRYRRCFDLNRLIRWNLGFRFIIATVRGFQIRQPVFQHRLRYQWSRRTFTETFSYRTFPFPFIRIDADANTLVRRGWFQPKTRESSLIPFFFARDRSSPSGVMFQLEYLHSTLNVINSTPSFQGNLYSFNLRILMKF